MCRPLCRICLPIVVLGALLLAPLSVRADALALWTFESSTLTTAGPFAAESGVNAGSSAARGGTLGTYSSVAGNGSAKAYNSNGWDIGDYWQFSVSTSGFAGLTLTFDQAGSGTGPRDFKVATSTDGTTFTDLPGSAYTVTLSDWSTVTPHLGFTHVFTLPTSLDNLSTAYIRLIDTSTTSINAATVAAGGTDRIDNVSISAAPEPATVVSAACMSFAIAAGFLRRKLRSA